MAELFKTNLVLVAAPLPADFEGTPQEFLEAIVERSEIQSPVGTNFFVVGDIEPSTNQGPWLKNGDRWYVFDDDEGKYVPINIEDSETKLFVISESDPGTPGEGDPTIWLRLVGTRVITWYFWTGTEWRPGGNRPPSGPTTSRPSNPFDLEQFFDTTINSLIHWERGAWRTVSGTPGDVKFVATEILQTALSANPGWEYLGQSDQGLRGRTLAVAAKDSGATPATVFATDSGITARAAGEKFGEENHVLSSTEIEQHTHLTGALTLLNSDNNAFFHRVDNGDTFLAPTTRPPNHAEVRGEGTPNGTKTGELPSTAAGTMLVTSRQLSLSSAPSYTGVAVGHNTVQPTVYYWALRKL